MEMRGENEDALVEDLRRGEPGAVRRLIEAHGPTMTRVALALCRRVEDAEAIVQDALIQAHRSLTSFDPARGTLRSWLVGLTANRARQVRRGLSRYGSLLERMGREPPVPADPSTTREDLAFARRRLALLPRREREAFVLVDLEELSSMEAARVMGISDSTVRVLALRARSRLQQGRSEAPARKLTAE